MNISKTLLVGIVAAATGLPASAAVVSFSDEFSSTTNWGPENLEVSSFDSSLGTLTSVKLSLYGKLSTLGKIESLDNAPATVTSQVSGTVNGAGPVGANVAVALAGSVDTNVGPFDGSLDFGGTSGVSDIVVMDDDTAVFLYAMPLDLAAFTDQGILTYVFSATAISSASGAGNLFSQFQTSGLGRVTVEYTYDRPTSVPAPAALGLLGLAVAGMGFAGRRARKA